VEIWVYPVAIAAGILAGFINTLAGSGSLITLPMLMFMGLPAPVANGTNRIGVLFQNVVGMWKFNQKGKLPLKGSAFLMLPTVLGAIAGAMIAVDLDEKTMHRVIAGIMALMLVVILFKPEKWLRKDSDPSVKVQSVGNFLALFAVGAYGGFIQAGVGIFMLAAMVLGCGFSMVHANAVKLLLVLVFTVPSLVIFALNNQLHLGLGLLMAVGQGMGAWLAGHFAMENKNATIWMRRLLIGIIIISIVRLLS